jgi:hypothetical protein
MQRREKMEWGHRHRCHCCHCAINEEEEEDNNNARGGLGSDQGCDETSMAGSELVDVLASLNGDWIAFGTLWLQRVPWEKEQRGRRGKAAGQARRSIPTLTCTGQLCLTL